MPGVKQAVIRFGSLTMVSRVTGFVRNMVLAGALGRTGLADSYLLANTIPNILYENVVGGVATALLLPRLVESQKRFGTQSREAWGVASQLLWGITLFLVVLAVVGMLLAGPIVEAMTAYGGVGRQADREAAVRFFEIFAWQIPFYGLNAVLMAILNSHDRFSLTAAAPILNNVMAAGAIAGYGLGWWGVDGLALGTTAGVAAMVLVQLPAAWHLGLPCLPEFSRGTTVFRGLAGLSWPVALTSLISLVAITIRSNFLFTEEGGTTTFTYCFQLIMTPYGILAVPISTVLYPRMARAYVNGDIPELGRIVRTAMGATVAVVLPVSIGLFLLAEPVIELLFERGAFHAGDTWTTARFLQVYAWVLVPHSLSILLSRPFYSMSDTRTPAAIQAGGILLSLLFAWLLLPSLGIQAVAWGALLGNGLGCGSAMVLLTLRLGMAGSFANLIGGVVRLVVAALVPIFLVGSILPLLAVPELRFVAPITRPAIVGQFDQVLYSATPGVSNTIPMSKWRSWWATYYPHRSPPEPLIPGGDERRLLVVWFPQGSLPSNAVAATLTPTGPKLQFRLMERVPQTWPSGPSIQQGAVIQWPDSVLPVHSVWLSSVDWPSAGSWFRILSPVLWCGGGGVLILLLYGAGLWVLRVEELRFIQRGFGSSPARGELDKEQDQRDSPSAG